MVDRDTYKTKLCAQYQRGRCRFNFCKFAHGSAELRRPFTVGIKNLRQRYCFWNGHRGSVELRERLHRNRSPLCNSPDRRDGKARQTSHGDSSPEKRIDRNVRKRTRWDVRGDYSGRMSEDQIEDRRRVPSEAKMQIDDQLREKYAEISLLEDDKQQLQMYLEDKVNEVDSLTFEIHELEMQLSEEKEEGKRFTTKVKKFIEAHNRHLRLQDELKRSEAQLQNLVEHLDLDAGEGNEDDPNIKALSDDEGQLNFFSRRLRSRVEVRETSPQAGGRTEIRKNMVEKPHRSSRNHTHFGNSKRPEADVDAYNSGGPSTFEENPRKAPEGSNLPTEADKYKGNDENVDVDGVDKETVEVDIV